MNHVEEYAIGLVVAGAVSFAEDDADENEEFGEDTGSWEQSTRLAGEMAESVKNNSESFLNWFRSL